MWELRGGDPNPGGGWGPFLERVLVDKPSRKGRTWLGMGGHKGNTGGGDCLWFREQRQEKTCGPRVMQGIHGLERAMWRDEA